MLHRFGTYSIMMTACSLLVLGIACGKKSKPAEPTLPATLIFVTDPPGATVYWDGEELEQRTTGPGEPATCRLEEVPQGAHTLRLVLEGYATIVEDYNLNSSGTKRVERTFELTGTLVIRSDPPGANVWMGTELQGTTPLTLPNLIEGTWVITLTLDGHVARTDTVEVLGNQTSTVVLPMLEPPKLSTVLFYAYNTETQVMAEEPSTTFIQREFVNTEAEQMWDRVRFIATFAAPVEGDFVLDVELYHGAEKFFTYHLDMKKGDQTLTFDIANTVPPPEPGKPGYFIAKGTYKIEFVAGDSIDLGEGTFEVR